MRHLYNKIYPIAYIRKMFQHGREAEELQVATLDRQGCWEMSNKNYQSLPEFTSLLLQSCWHLASFHSEHLVPFCRK